MASLNAQIGCLLTGAAFAGPQTLFSGQTLNTKALVKPKNTIFSIKSCYESKQPLNDAFKRDAASSIAHGFEMKNPATFLFTHGLHGIDAMVIEHDPECGNLDVSNSSNSQSGVCHFEKRIVDWLASNFKRDQGIDLLKDKEALQRLTEAAEKANTELSSLTQTNISLSSITVTPDGPKHIHTTLTRAKFEELCSDLLDMIRITSEESLSDAKLESIVIDSMIFATHSTCIPAVHEQVKKVTGKDPKMSLTPTQVYWGADKMPWEHK